MRILKTKTERKPREKNHRIDEVFKPIIVPLLKEDDYEATFLLEHIQGLYPGKYSGKDLRTLQRRVEEYNASLDKDHEIMFRQEHKPGVLMVCDFTHPKEKIKVTINGKPFKLILFHARLPHSGLSYMQVFEGSGESIEKLSQGLNNAFEYMGGVPEKLRTDSLSAAFKNLSKKESEDLTQRFQAVVDHYEIEATRINKGKSHENGAIESPHGHVKTYLRQSLAIRGSINFDSGEAYQAFIMESMEKRNLRCNKTRVAAECASLKPLPSSRALEYQETSVRVSSGSIIQVRNSVYTVPPSLIGKMLLVRLYNDRLACYLGHKHVATLKRVYSTTKERERNIDPRHLLPWLMRKPGAFAHYVYRDDLLKNLQYLYIWEYISRTMSEQAASKLMVRLLKLAYIYSFEDEVAAIVIDWIEKERVLDITALENRFIPKREIVSALKVAQHDLSAYKDLMNRGAQI